VEVECGRCLKRFPVHVSAEILEHHRIHPLHAPIAEDEDLFGTAVNMAVRIAAQAKGTEILVSDVVRQLVAGKGLSFADRGDVALRGFEEPVRLYEVRWREDE
jgi:class 3 adenylate cyclase